MTEHEAFYKYEIKHQRAIEANNASWFGTLFFGFHAVLVLLALIEMLAKMGY